MNTLQLAGEESALLHRVLTSALDQLHDEIAHTDDREFREALKQDRESLSRILQQLPQPDTQ